MTDTPFCRLRVLAVAGLALQTVCTAASAQSPDLADLSIEELSQLQVTTVSRVGERLADAPAAAFVITADEIRRSGATTIPDALRLAPGVEVARRDPHSWAISIRGFNSDLSNKLLVLIDGRSVYSPLYAGVFWDVQDMPLEDIDRIEVIAGPGGTLWGANAVNGVINIITRSATTTRGAFVEVGAGNEEQTTASFRYGGMMGDRVAARVYAKYVDRDSFETSTGGDATDGARQTRAGFRLDWDSLRAAHFTVEGDVYTGEESGVFQDSFTLGTLPAGTTVDDIGVSGGNVLARWERTLPSGTELSLQTYYDHTQRDIPNTYDESRDTLDVDFQHHSSLGTRNDVLWGAALRWTGDRLGNTLFATFDPDHRDDLTSSAFFQDKLAIKPERLFLTLGSKFEHNDYTGFEVQPNVRFTWLMDDRHSFWSAVSRAVRVPSRLDSDLRLTVPLAVPTLPFPVYVTADGSDDFGSSKLLAYEAGYRFQPARSLSFDVAAFRNDYDDLQTVEPQAPVLVLVPPLPYAILPQTLENLMEGRAVGATVTANWEPLDRWRLRFQYSRLDLDLWTKPGSLDTTRPKLAGNSPRNQAAVLSFIDLAHSLQLYTGVRYVDPLPNLGVDSYLAVDASLRWTPKARLTTSLTIDNLNDAHHLEYGGADEIERSALLRVVWSFGPRG